MHVCFVSREFPPNYVGGIGSYVENMAMVLLAAGHDVSVLTKWHESVPVCGWQSPRYSHGGRLRVYHLPFVNERWEHCPSALSPEFLALAEQDVAAPFAWQVAEALDHILPTQAIDVIESQEYEAPLSVYLARRQSWPLDHPLRAVPCVVHLHSPSHLIQLHNDDLPTTASYYRRALELFTIREADALLCPSAYLAGQVAEWSGVPRDSIAVIPYPLGPPLRRSTKAPHPNRCLFVGRIEPRKGVFEFIEAAIPVARDLPRVEFHFAGASYRRELPTGEHCDVKALLQSMMPAAVRQQFIFRGSFPRARLPQEYAQALFTVVPSRWENYPNTCIEAMANGRAVLCSDQGGMVEMVEDGVSGLIAGPGACRRRLVASLEAKLREAFTHDPATLLGMGERARERITSLCDNERILQAHLEYYRRVRPRGAGGRLAALPATIHVGIFWSAKDPCADALATFGDIDRQTLRAARKVLVRGDGLDSWVTPPEGWESAHLHGDAPHDSCGIGRDTWSRLLFASETADVVLLGRPGLRLHETLFERVSNLMRANPRVGFCTSWTRAPHGERVQAPCPPDAAMLLLADSPCYWFLRVAALRDIGSRFDGVGDFLDDTLRDRMLHLLRIGWHGAVIPMPGMTVQQDQHYPCWSELAFHTDADSWHRVLLAHVDVLHADGNLGLLAMREHGRTP